tara:strand:+ start:262 stop:474 length:213 start_codon:yes stop_codon:yes gene_type:complete
MQAQAQDKIQDISIRNVKSVSVNPVERLQWASGIVNEKKYYRTMVIRTDEGEYIELTLFATDEETLQYEL